MTVNDWCVEKEAPCRYLEEEEGSYRFVIAPLPQHLRVGKILTELGCWVE
jgi:hypothetical protein